MRDLQRNKQFVYYALYQSKTAVLDNGKKTGEWDLTYSPITELQINVSSAKGTTEEEIFGVGVDYSHIMATCRKLPIKEETNIWYGFGKIKPYHGRYAIGDLCTYNGLIYECKTAITTPKAWSANDWVAKPHNYKIIRVAHSINSTLYAIKEVDVNA